MTGSGGEKATDSPRWTQPAWRFRNHAKAFAAVRNRRPESNLASKNHSRTRRVVQAALPVPRRREFNAAPLRFFCPAGGRICP